MIEGQARPLEIASRVLKPETIQMIRQDSKFRNLAYSVLDRWALNQPDELKSLEKEDQDGFGLRQRIYEQVEMETEALSSETAAQAQSMGMSDWEILEMLGIDTRVRTIASHWAPLE